MTKRERLKAVMRGEVPDCVPVCPDISNMVPCRLTGKPFWDIYVYQNPPLWKAYIDAVKHFDIDGGFELYDFGDLFGDPAHEHWERRIVHRNPNGSFVTQDFNTATGDWSRDVLFHTADNPPASGVPPEKLGLPAVPSTWEAITGVREWPSGMALWKHIRRELGEHGVLGMLSGATTCLFSGPEDIYEYTEAPERFHERREELLRKVSANMEKIAELEDRPDFLFCGASGSLVWQPFFENWRCPSCSM